LSSSDTSAEKQRGRRTVNAPAKPLSEPAPPNSVALTLISDDEYILQMDVSVISLGGDNVAAVIDPIITIDPAFADDFHLIFSEGVGNSPEAPAVPSPGSLPLFASGLALMGWLVWRRKA
jgi:hypothetical protein